MRWGEVAKAISSMAEVQPGLAHVYGDSIRAAGHGDHKVPLLEYSLITDSLEDEIWEPCIIQWDQFVNSMDDLALSERSLRATFHHDVPVRIMGLYMFSEFLGGDMLVSPDQHGYYGRAARFRYTPIMEEYTSTKGAGDAEL